MCIRDRYTTDGLVVAHTDQKMEDEATAWLRKQVKPEDSIAQVTNLCLTAWRALMDNKGFGDLSPSDAPFTANGKTVEVALLDRKLGGPVQYRPLDLSKIKG